MCKSFNFKVLIDSNSGAELDKLEKKNGEFCTFFPLPKYFIKLVRDVNF